MLWVILIAVGVFGAITVEAVSQVGIILGQRLDEKIGQLNEKIDGLQEKLDEIESKQDESTSTYVNPIDL